MKFLVKLYDKTLQWSQHPLAPRYLAAVSFVDASFFPMPPFFMLTPMALAKPDRAHNYALIATVASVAGGMLGYLLGMLLFNPVVLPLLEYFNYVDKYQQAVTQLQANGFWAVLVAGFMPIPFKFIAIGSGVMHIPIAAFLGGSILGRAVKFYLVAYVIKFGGAKMEQKLRLAIEKLGLVILLAVAGLAVIALSGCTKEQAPARHVHAVPTIHRHLDKYNKTVHYKEADRSGSKQHLADYKGVDRPRYTAKDKESFIRAKMATRAQDPVKTGRWIWPTEGTILQSFAKSNNKGIDIAGIEGDPVVAANDGEVVYSGNGLRDYGNLIIIKHDKNYLTAYAHNRKNLVKEHDKIYKGQRIAEMGRSGTEKVKLHFEVRRQGKPVDPVSVLPRR